MTTGQFAGTLAKSIWPLLVIGTVAVLLLLHDGWRWLQKR